VALPTEVIAGTLGAGAARRAASASSGAVSPSPEATPPSNQVALYYESFATTSSKYNLRRRRTQLPPLGFAVRLMILPWEIPDLLPEKTVGEVSTYMLTQPQPHLNRYD